MAEKPHTSISVRSNLAVTSVSSSQQMSAPFAPPTVHITTGERQKISLYLYEISKSGREECLYELTLQISPFAMLDCRSYLFIVMMFSTS